jgi:hypothetical protein
MQTNSGWCVAGSQADVFIKHKDTQIKEGNFGEGGMVQ